VLVGRRAEVDRVRSSSQLLRGIAALGGASRDLRANGVAAGAIADVDDLSRRTTRDAWRSGLVADAGVQLAPLLAGLSAVAAAALLAATGDPRATVAVVGLLLLATGEPLAAAVAGAHRLPALLAALAPLAEVLTPTRRTERGTAPIEGPVLEVSLDDLSLGWESGAPIATGVRARVRRGDVLFVRGPSGSGKTTLLTTLLGDLPVRGGRLDIDGVALDAIDPAAWRARVAWCPQEAHVFDSTLRGNLIIGRARAHVPADDDLHDVLRRVGLKPLLEGLDDGLDARVGPGGRWLSGGERQRLAVARTLLGDADVVLLDEPTAHLDAPTAAAVMADLRRALADRIVVLVSHRTADRDPDDLVLDLGQTGRSSSAATWPATSRSRARATSTQAARSISGNDTVRPDRGGHSSSNVPPWISPGSNPVPSAANTVSSLPEA
jgi:ATP-binding cassette subfamily C protein CydCD